jgi:hypothetical protein
MPSLGGLTEEDLPTLVLFTVCSSRPVGTKISILLWNLLPLENNVHKLRSFLRSIHNLQKGTSSFAMSNLIEFIRLCYGTARHLKGQQGIRR